MKKLAIAGIVFAVLVAGYGVAIAAGMEDEGSMQNQVVIERPAEVVFAYCADMRHEVQWNPDVVSMAKVTDGPIGLGTRFAARWKQSGDVLVEVTRFEPPRALTLTNGGDLEATVEISLAPQGRATLFTSKFTARPHGFLKVIFPVFKRMMAKFEKANMGHLKAAIERS